MIAFRPFYKKLWIVGGVVCLLLSIVAYIVPLIPTPPFIAASLYCFAKGSEKFHNWLIYETVFGKYFLIFREKGALPKRFKYILLVILLFGTLFSCTFVLNSWLLRGTLLFFAIIGGIAFWRIKNIEDL